MTSAEDIIRNKINEAISGINNGRFEEADALLSSLDGIFSMIATATMLRAYALKKSGNEELSKELAAKSAAMDGNCLQQGLKLGLNFDRYLGDVSEFCMYNNVGSPEVSRGRRTSFWPESIEIKDMKDVMIASSNHILIGGKYESKFLTKDKPIVTLGSCFATNIGRSLKSLGFDVNNNAFNDEATNSYAIRYFFDWVSRGDTSKFTSFFAKTYGEDARNNARHSLADAQAVILTFGVAPCLFHKETNEFAFTGRRNDKIGFEFLDGEYALRTTSVEENKQNILRVAESIRGINPTCKIVITVSPVPLMGTSEMDSAIIADCVSKSTIRVAVHEIMDKIDNSLYWPSFEIIRWMGGHSQFSMFGADDGLSRHVNRRVVDAIVELFAERFVVDQQHS